MHTQHLADRPTRSAGFLPLFCFSLGFWLLSAAAVLQAQPVIEDPIQTEVTEPTLTGLLTRLTQASLKEKAALIPQLASLNDERVPGILQALLKGHLYYRKADQQVVFAKKQQAGYRIRDGLTDQDLGKAGRRDVRKIKVNNRLRSLIRSNLALLSLNDADAAVRLKAVKNLKQPVDVNSARLLRQRLTVEQDSEVQSALQTTLAIVDLDSSDQATRLTAVQTLSGNLSPAVRSHLNRLAEKNSDGAFMEADPQVAQAAQKALNSIQTRLDFYQSLETLFFGLSLGSVLVLAAIGLAITFGVMGVINMAHGELMMIGAYTTYGVQLLMPEYIDWSLLVAIPAAFIISGLFGIAIERGVIRFLYGRPLETLLATFGISLVLQQLVRSVFSPLNRSVSTPGWMSGQLEINPALSLTLNRLYVIAFALVVFWILLLVLKKTRLGLEVRAVSQNRAMARSMGIRSEWVDAMTFGLGSGIAGVAGVALSQLTNVGPNLGQSYIIDSFMVVVFGGVGNLWGTLIGGMSLGIANKFLEPSVGAVLAKILVLLAIILFIQKRPRGLFPQKGRAAEH